MTPPHSAGADTPSARRRPGFAPALTHSLRVAAAACAGLLLLASPGQAQQQKKQARPAAEQVAAPQPADIDRNGVLILVRGVLMALDQANRTGNYTVFRDLAAPGFQTNTSARLGELFGPQREQQLDLGGVAVLEPQLTGLPQIENGMLRITGFFPSVPRQVHFDLLFAPHERRWKLFGIMVDLKDGGPLAPETAADDAPPPAKPETALPPTLDVLPKPAPARPAAGN